MKSRPAKPEVVSCAACKAGIAGEQAHAAGKVTTPALARFMCGLAWLFGHTEGVKNALEGRLVQLCDEHAAARPSDIIGSPRTIIEQVDRITGKVEHKHCFACSFAIEVDYTAGAHFIAGLAIGVAAGHSIAFAFCETHQTVYARCMEDARKLAVEREAKRPVA